ncbi:hypothetical protein V8E52_007364 [Russula decolorans]
MGTNQVRVCIHASTTRAEIDALVNASVAWVGGILLDKEVGPEGDQTLIKGKEWARAGATSPNRNCSSTYFFHESTVVPSTDDRQDGITAIEKESLHTCVTGGMMAILCRCRFAADHPSKLASSTCTVREEST